MGNKSTDVIARENWIWIQAVLFIRSVGYLTSVYFNVIS